MSVLKILQQPSLLIRIKAKVPPTIRKPYVIYFLNTLTSSSTALLRYSENTSYLGLLAVPQTCHGQSCLGVFAFTVHSWSTPLPDDHLVFLISFSFSAQSNFLIEDFPGQPTQIGNLFLFPPCPIYLNSQFFSPSDL